MANLPDSVSRRQALRVLSVGGLGAVLAACSSSGGETSSSASSAASDTTGAQPGSSAADTTPAAADTTASDSTVAAATGEACDGVIPTETGGPYPGDGTNGPNVLAADGVVRQDIRSSFGSSTTAVDGVPLTLEFTVVDATGGCAPVPGLAVYAWHCSPDGLYSMYSQGAENENYLRGVQVTDADGVARFTTVFPGCYSGRWPHVHMEVYADEASALAAKDLIVTTQLAFTKESSEAVYADGRYPGSTANLGQLSLETDNVFADDGGVHELGTFTGDPSTGYVGKLTIGVDPSIRTTPGGDGFGAGGPMGPGGPPPSGPGIPPPGAPGGPPAGPGGPPPSDMLPPTTG